MNSTIEKAINQQITEELVSSYAYLAISAYAEKLNLKGFAHWFLVQSKEETDHALGFFNFLVDRNGVVTLKAIPQPKAEFDGPLGMFKTSLQQEQGITRKIHALYELAGQEKDYALQTLLQWYIDEQVEEEASAQQLIDTITLIGENDSMLYKFDRDLAKREYQPLNPRG